MEQHHKYGFSKWPALLCCPHFESQDAESKASRSGTENHADLSEELNSINTGIPSINNNDGSKWAANYISSLAKANYIHSEERTEVIAEDKPAHGVYGTCDAYFIDDESKELYVFDYKSGASNDIDYMSQVMGYAYSISLETNVNPDRIHCYVLYGASKEIRESVFTWNDLVSNANAVMTKALNKEAYQPACSRSCSYCKHNKECSVMTGNLIAFKKNELTDMTDASLYEWLVAAKAMIEKKMEELKTQAVNNGGVLEDSRVRYVIKQDKHGKMKSIDVNSLWFDMSAAGCSVTQTALLSCCSISKKAFIELYKDDAKSNGLLLKDIERMYADRCVNGEPAVKMVKEEK